LEFPTNDGWHRECSLNPGLRGDDNYENLRLASSSKLQWQWRRRTLLFPIRSVQWLGAGSPEPCLGWEAWPVVSGCWWLYASRSLQRSSATAPGHSFRCGIKPSDMNPFRIHLFSAGKQFQRTAAPRVAEEQLALLQQVLPLARGSGLVWSWQREVNRPWPFGWVTRRPAKAHISLIHWSDESFPVDVGRK
jgi:hypothetical protein